jgi:site-specific recombinase XerD
MADTKYLECVNGWWTFKRRIPQSTNTKRIALKTKILKVAQASRDDILSRWNEIAAETQKHKNIWELRKSYLLADPKSSDREAIEEILSDDADRMAMELGVHEALNIKASYEDLTDKEKIPVDHVRFGLGALTPFEKVVPLWLESLDNKKTRSDYRKGLERLMTQYAVAEEITWKKADHYLKAAPKKFGLSKATIQKDKTAILNLWGFLELEPQVWQNHKIPATPHKTVKRLAWKNSEVIQLLEAARGDNKRPWLYHAINIAAYTGAREGAIAECEYIAEHNLIRFPAKKREAKSRQIHIHPNVAESVVWWTNNKTPAQQTIANTFGKLKADLGFEKDVQCFHSFRHALIQHLRANNVEQKTIQAIVGHKEAGVTAGRYGASQQLLDTVAEAIELIDYTRDDFVGTYD